MDGGKKASELRHLGYRKATVWIVDHDNQPAKERWRESARLAAEADKRDRSNEIGAFLLDEMLRDDQ